MLTDHCYAVIMAGGAGSRLWPLSRKHEPKHLLKLFDGKCLIDLTIDRLKGHVSDDHIVVLTNVNHKELTQQVLTRIPPENFIFEPCVRDTASAIGLAATVLKQRCEDPTMIMLTADQIIEPAEAFGEAIENAADFLDTHPEMLIAFGVEASCPNTAVGWQKLGEALDFPDCEVRRIDKFIEKPELARAQRYMEEGGYCWNSGQFAWKASAILQEIAAHLPEAAAILEQIRAAWTTASRDEVLRNLFPKMPKGSIDYKIMQKTSNACSIFLPCSWEDMGTHAAMAERIGTKQRGNIVCGKAMVTGTGNMVFAQTDQAVVVARDDLVVVVTDNTVFVGDTGTDMKALVENISRQAPELL